MNMMRPRFKNNYTGNQLQSPLPLEGLPRIRQLHSLKNALYTTLLIASLVSIYYALSTPYKVGNMDLTYLKTDPSLAIRLIQLQNQQQTNQSNELAIKESHGFFTDIPSNKWEMLKAKAHSIQPNTRGNPLDKKTSSSLPATWFQQHYEPEFVCPFERRIGRLGDGGKWICDPHRISAKSSCLVYSIGSNGDASFESAISDDVSSECEIHVFDFDDYAYSVEKQTNHSKNVHYHQWGISSFTGGKFKTLEDTALELGHTGKTIDIFKIDCEGCELDTYSSWLNAPVVLQQIVVEIHPIFTLFGSRMKLPETVELFESLKKAGYVITHKEPNVQYSHLKLCVEFNFLKLSPEFWNG